MVSRKFTAKPSGRLNWLPIRAAIPHAALLPLIPLQRAGLIDLSMDIICDSKSGVTGAGKTPTANTHFSEVSESFKAYNVRKHRHAPEIWQELNHDHLIFTPHLLPINRGILSTLYLRLRNGVTEQDISHCYQANYQAPALYSDLPERGSIRKSNMWRIPTTVILDGTLTRRDPV